MKEYLELFVSFAKIGAMTFGGGPAMLPMLERELVTKRAWVSEEEILDYFAIGQCTPGIIAVNTATFIGQKRKGLLGGIIATLGIVFPSVVIIDLIAALLSNFADIDWVQSAFAGIRVCVCALVLNALIKLAKKSVKDIWTAIIFVAVAVCTVALDISPIVYVVLAAVLGIVIKNVSVGAGAAGSGKTEKEDKK